MSDYAATIVRIEELTPVPGLDNLLKTRLLGYETLVGKETQLGDVGVLFVAETQLSEQYARANNLYRHAELNASSTKKGYLDDNRRIRAVKFMGHTSNCLFMPLESLGLGDFELYSDEILMSRHRLKIGATFTTLGSVPICNKYESPATRAAKAANVAKLAQGPKSFPKHTDTSQWFKSEHTVGPTEILHISQKLHGTSIRIGNVKLDLPWYKKALKHLGFPVKTHGPVVGSRNVVKNLNDTTDLWVRVGKPIAEKLPPDTIVFGEIVGWDGQKAIQANYTYGLPKGECALYVYNTVRGGIHSTVPPSGLKPVPWFQTTPKQFFDATEWLNRQFAAEGRHGALPLSDPKTVDEGICIRVLDKSGGLRVYKAKSSGFLEWETKQLDKNVADLESVS